MSAPNSETAPEKKYQLSEGEIDPGLGKKVQILVQRAAHYVVYLDEKLEIQWRGHLDHWPKHTGRVLNRVSRLTAISSFLRGHTQFADIRTMIGDGIARLLDGDSESDISTGMDEAERLITHRNRECSRLWFFGCAAGFAALCAFAAVVTFYLRSRLGATPATVISTTLLGSVGALASVALRSEKLGLDANAGMWLHFAESCARLIVGMVAALLVALFIKAGLFASSIVQSDHSLAVHWSLAILAGASERALPGFIRKGEELLSGAGSIPAPDAKGQSSNETAETAQQK